MISFDANIDLSLPAAGPDTYNGADGTRPVSDFVVSRTMDGRVLSQYSEACWDISTWDSDLKPMKIYFQFWHENYDQPSRVLIAEEARWLLFATVWLRDGPPVKPGTVGRYMAVIRYMARFADSESVRMQDVLSKKDLFLTFVEEGCSASACKSLNAMLNQFTRMGKHLLGFEVIGSHVKKPLLKKIKEYKESLNQHAPIPTRIYSEILVALSSELSEWENVAVECLTLLRRCSTDASYGRREGAQLDRAKSGCSRVHGVSWENVASSKLRSYLNRTNLPDSVVGLASAATHVQGVAKLTAQAYSGMRDDEALTLPYDCKQEFVSGGRLIRLIGGRTTKLNKSIRQTRWVTNQEGHRAIALAQEIADAIYDGCGSQKQESGSRRGRRKNVGRPLFVSIAYLPIGGNRRAPPRDNFFHPGSISLDKLKRLRKIVAPLITDADIDELEQIDAHRAWRMEDGFMSGRPWQLKTHQLRRSLALYAQRSGIVSLPSLRRQLQQLTEEMTQYYTRGSEYAKDIFSGEHPDPGHFCFDWQNAQVLSQAVSYAVNVLTSDEQLFGGHIAFVRQHVLKEENIVTPETRRRTFQMFNNGQINYRETILGGCTKQGECESPAVDWLNLDCVTKNCANLVGKITNLEKIITEQKRLVESLPAQTLLFRTESLTLSKLLEVHAKVILDNRSK